MKKIKGENGLEKRKRAKVTARGSNYDKKKVKRGSGKKREVSGKELKEKVKKRKRTGEGGKVPKRRIGKEREVKKEDKSIKKKVPEREAGGKIDRSKGKLGDKKVKKETPKEIKPKKKLIKKIEKISFPAKKRVKKKRRKPKFKREGLKGIKKRDERWRKPRGIDSKKHVGKRGKGKVPKIGYKQPITEAGLVNGLKAKRVYNLSQLENILIEREGIIISGSVGRKKRNEIIKQANKLKITILNPRKGEL